MSEVINESFTFKKNLKLEVWSSFTFKGFKPMQSLRLINCFVVARVLWVVVIARMFYHVASMLFYIHVGRAE